MLITWSTCNRIACVSVLAATLACTLFQLAREIGGDSGSSGNTQDSRSRQNLLETFSASINPSLPGSELLQSATTIDDSANLDTSRAVNLGDVIQGSPIQHTFLLRNSSRDEITVTNVVKSCSCQSVNLSKDFKWPAGKLLRFTYGTPTLIPGSQSARLLIHTDSKDDSLREISIALNATVTPIIMAAPSRLELGAVSRNGVLEKEIRILSRNSWIPTEYRGVSSVKDAAAVSIASTSAKGVTIRFQIPATANAGNFTDVVSMRFIGPDRQLLSIFIPVDGFIEDDVPGASPQISDLTLKGGP